MIKIGLFGDSFGYQKPNNPFECWVDLLSQHYDIENFCQCGASEYRILQQIMAQNLDNFDVLLITHTSAMRTYVPSNPLHADDLVYKNCDIIFSDVEHRQDKFSMACQQYFKHIFDIKYATDIHNLVCKAIHEQCGSRLQLHITHFDYKNFYQFPNMKNFYDIWLENQGPVNHYNQPGNQLVYQRVKNELDKLL